MHTLLLVLACLAQEKDTLRVGWTPPATLDPAKGATLADARVLAQIFEGLVTFAADHKTVAPGMAERWNVGEDRLVWTFFLGDAKWSDGEPVTAGDFVFAWRRLLDSGASYPHVLRMFRNGGAYLDAREAELLAETELDDETIRRIGRTARKNLAPRLERLALQASGEKRTLLQEALAAAKTRDEILMKDLGFEAVDAKTLRVHLEAATPWFLDTLAFMPLYPVPEKFVRTLGAKWSEPKIVVTNGAYRIEKSEASALTLARVRGGGPEKVVLEWLQPADALRRFGDQKLDWLDAETIPAAAVAKAALEPEFHYFDLWGTWYLKLNTARDPFQRLGARRAVAHATDRRPLIEVARLNPATSLVPPGFDGYRGATAPKFGASDGVLALLDAYADITAMPTIELLATDSNREIAEKLKAQWEKHLGVNVHVNAMRPPAYVEALYSGKWDAAITAWAGEVFDPSSFLDPWTKGHPLNTTGWSHDGFEALVAAARAEADPVKRLEILTSAEKVLVETDVVSVPLFTMGSFALLAERVQGFAGNPQGRVLLQHVRLGK